MSSASRRNPCPFCGTALLSGPRFIRQVGPATYAYEPCGCHVQFDRHGYPHRPKNGSTSTEEA